MIKLLISAILIFTLFGCGAGGIDVEQTQPVPSDAFEEQTVIDLLVFYTPNLQYAETTINHMVSTTNNIFRNTGLDVVIRVVKIKSVDYPADSKHFDAIHDMIYQRGQFSEMRSLRERYGADLVTLVRPYNPGHGACGVAWVNPNIDKIIRDAMMSSVSATTCPEYVLAHEIGHNLGLNHSRLQDYEADLIDIEGNRYTYALGHGIYNYFTTIMADMKFFNAKFNTYTFSSPNVKFEGNDAGVDKDDPYEGADAKSILDKTSKLASELY